MGNIIYISKENNNYYLNYNNFKSICYIGKNGLSIEKKEGDLKTPIGIFELGLAFGTHSEDELKIDNNIKYIKITKDLYWVDDINSKYYNQLVNINEVNKDWNSAEYLLENAIPYEYAIEIKTNPQNIPNKGSAIFIHCMNKEYTAGCISLPKNKMLELLRMINKDTKIIIND